MSYAILVWLLVFSGRALCIRIKIGEYCVINCMQFLQLITQFGAYWCHMETKILASIGSGNGLSPIRHQATLNHWNLNKNTIAIKKMNLNLLSAKCWPFCLMGSPLAVAGDGDREREPQPSTSSRGHKPKHKLTSSPSGSSPKHRHKSTASKSSSAKHKGRQKSSKSSKRWPALKSSVRKKWCVLILLSVLGFFYFVSEKNQWCLGEISGSSRVNCSAGFDLKCLDILSNLWYKMYLSGQLNCWSQDWWFSNCSEIWHASWQEPTKFQSSISILTPNLVPVSAAPTTSLSIEARC